MYDTPSVTDLRVALGVRIEELRIAARLPRAQLAEALCVDTRPATYELEAGWPGPEMTLSLRAIGGSFPDSPVFVPKARPAASAPVPTPAIDPEVLEAAIRRSLLTSYQTTAFA